MIRALIVLAALTLVPAVPAVPAVLAEVPPVLVPPHADSIGVGSAPAPLLIPGRASPTDLLRRTPEQLAREQYALGREFERVDQPAGAIAAYRNAIRLQPSLPEAHFRMGRLFTAVAQHQAAVREYEAELVHQPGHRDAERALALERAQLGDTTSAIAGLERLTGSDPADQASWQALGFAYSTAGRVVEGERALRRALALDLSDADAWRDLGTVLAAQKRDREAREAYRRAAGLAPRDAAVWVNLGNLERRMGRSNAALDAYREAIRRDSSLAFAWRGRIAVLDGLGRPLEAAKTFRAWLARGPKDNDLRIETIARYAALGRTDVALVLAREGVRLAPKSGEAHLALGIALRGANGARASLPELRRAQSLFGSPDQRARVGALIAAMRARAPDSLRGLFAADSASHEAPAAPDSLGRLPAR